MRGPAVLALCAVLVGLSSVWKGACLDPRHNFSRTCYSDVLELFSSRGLDAPVFPYIHGRLVGGAPVDTFEYPVLTGVFIWFSSLFADGRASFLLGTTVLLLPFALMIAWQLHVLVGRRALLWAASPALVLYALHNWDLLVVAAATGGITSWARGRYVGAAVLFGLGACLKIYPGLFLVPLVVDRLVRRDVAGALRTGAAGAGTVLAVNLPFALLGREGWAATYVFQSARGADSSSNSIWYWIYPHLATADLNRLVPLLVVLAAVAATAYGVVRARADESFPLVQVCAAVLVAFLLVNKVSSPQYTLWLLPFFALLALHWAWWVAFTVADLLVYVGVFRWLDALLRGADPTLPQDVLLVGVWSKSLLLLLLFPAFLRAASAVRLNRPSDRM